MAAVEIQALALSMGIILFLTHFIVKDRLIKSIILIFGGLGMLGADAAFGQGSNTTLMLLPAVTIMIFIGILQGLKSLTGRGE